MPAPNASHNPPTDQERSLATLAEVLSSRNRAILLSWVASRLETRFSLTELSRAVDVPISSLQHECYKLERLGVLQGRRDGTSRRYRVVLEHPLSRPLINLVIATLGLEMVLHNAVVEAGEMESAVIAGSEPGSETSQLTLVLVGQVGLEGMVRAQNRVALLLARPVDAIDLAYVQSSDWSADHALASRLQHRPLQQIVGTWPPTIATPPTSGEHTAP